MTSPGLTPTTDSFSLLAKLTALAIVHIFEASKPFGAFDAYVVLPDGAGASFGVSQFTHRSGSLLAVIKYYLTHGGKISVEYFKVILNDLANTSPESIRKLANDKQFKNALQLASETDEMRAAQVEIATKRYLQPAIDACEGSGFRIPMSLAVVYDSINQGAFSLIRDRVLINRKSYGSDLEFEKAWITHYVQNRDKWLENNNKPILRATDYRTDFFLAQIARGNWDLRAPMEVHGHRLLNEELNGNSNFFTRKLAAPVDSALDLENSPKPNGAGVGSDLAGNEMVLEIPEFSRPPQQPAEQQPAAPASSPQVVINNNAGDSQTAANNPPNASTDPAPAPPVKDETVVVEKVKADLSIWETGANKVDQIYTSFQTRYAALPTAVFGAGAAVWGFLNHASNWIIIVLIIGIFEVITAFIIGVIYLKNQDRARQEKQDARNHEAKMQAERQAHELNLVAAKSAIDPGSQTIKFVSDNQK